MPRLRRTRTTANPVKFLVGCATTTIAAGSQSASMANMEAACGSQQIHRVYLGSAYGASDYLNSTTAKVDFTASGQVDKRVAHLSFDPNALSLTSTDPAVSGPEITKVLAFLDGLPSWKRLIINPWHECDWYSDPAAGSDQRYATLFGDNFTAFRAAYKMIADWIHNGTPGASAATIAARRKNWRTCLLLTADAWKSFSAARKNPDNYWPGLDGNGKPYVDIMGIDMYNEGSRDGSGWDTPGAGFGYSSALEGYSAYRPLADGSAGGFLQWCESKGVQWWVIGELGCHANYPASTSPWTIDYGYGTPSSKPEWIREFGAFISRYQRTPGHQTKLLGVEYFNASGRVYTGPQWWTNSVHRDDNTYAHVVFDGQAVSTTLPAASSWTGKKYLLGATDGTWEGYSSDGTTWTDLGVMRREPWTLFNDQGDLDAWAALNTLYGLSATGYQFPAL